jgi:hypothetical protein
MKQTEEGNLDTRMNKKPNSCFEKVLDDKAREAGSKNCKGVRGSSGSPTTPMQTTWKLTPVSQMAFERPNACNGDGSVDKQHKQQGVLGGDSAESHTT